MNGTNVLRVCIGAEMTSLNFTNIEALNGSNYKKWKEDIEIALGLMDFNIAIDEDQPPALTPQITAEEKTKRAKWHKANKMALAIMRKEINETVRGGIPKCDNAKELLDTIANNFKESGKAETGSQLTKLTSMKYDGSWSVREHMLKISNIALKLKDLEVPMTDEFLVHMALNSLPAQYGQLKVWSVESLIQYSEGQMEHE